LEADASFYVGANAERWYAALGVREMWRAASRDGGNRVEVGILDLRSPDGPRPAAESAALPGLKAALLPEAFDLARPRPLRKARGAARGGSGAGSFLTAVYRSEIASRRNLCRPDIDNRHLRSKIEFPSRRRKNHAP